MDSDFIPTMVHENLGLCQPSRCLAKLLKVEIHGKTTLRERLCIDFSQSKRNPHEVFRLDFHGFGLGTTCGIRRRRRMCSNELLGQPR